MFQPIINLVVTADCCVAWPISGLEIAMQDIEDTEDTEDSLHSLHGPGQDKITSSEGIMEKSFKR